MRVGDSSRQIGIVCLVLNVRNSLESSDVMWCYIEGVRKGNGGS